MGSRNTPNWLRLEELEHRCTPGSVLDLLGDPLLASLGQSLVFLEATGTAVSPLLSGEQMIAVPSQAACPASRFDPTVPWLPARPGTPVAAGLSPSSPPLPGNSGADSIDSALLATWALVSPQDNTILAGTAAAGVQVPFKGSLEGTFTRTGFPVAFIELKGAGQATHLGKFMLYMPHHVDLATSTGLDGIFTFTAANGDTVYGTVTGQADPVPLPGILHTREEMIITGGTGRFAGASGVVISERSIDRVNLTTIGFFEGTISAPGR